MFQRNRRILESVCVLGARAVMVALFFSILLMPKTCFSQDPRKEINYPGDSSDVMWFIHITDAHITEKPVDTKKPYGRGIESPEQINLYWIVNDAFQTLKPSFIINTGDLTNGLSSQNINQWDIYYWIVNNSWANYENSYYDIPGNHDRYSDLWDGNGDNGYLHKSIMGRKFDPELNPIGQFQWGDNILGGKYFFYGLNTCDESGTSFSNYQYYWPMISDYPQLSEKELNDLVESFKKSDKPKLRFLFGHAGFYTAKTSPTYFPESWKISYLPGLFDDHGFVIGKVILPDNFF